MVSMKFIYKLEYCSIVGCCGAFKCVKSRFSFPGYLFGGDNLRHLLLLKEICVFWSGKIGLWLSNN